MDWFPLINSIRIALISTVIIFFVGIFSAYYISKAPRLVKGVLDVFLTLPLVLPPTVVVIFPLMYRTARGAFESFDETLAYSAQTLGLSNTYIFWYIRMPYCKQGILAGTVLAFARALGEYGATSMICGYTPGRTATISTTVYQLWRTNDDGLAFRWVLVNLAISFVVLLAVNLLEKKDTPKKGVD